MKKISVWARINRGSARILLVLLNLALVLLGIQTGSLLSKINFQFGSGAFYGVMLVFIFVLFAYPHRDGFRSLQSKNKVYRVQKSADFILAFFSFLMISFLSWNAYVTPESGLSLPFVNPISASNVAKPTAEEILQSLQHRSGKDLSRSEKKVLKHEFIKQVKGYVLEKAKGNDKIALKIFLVICTLVAALGIGYLVAGLACSLSCSGMDGLAVLVALFGLAGIIFGSIKLMRAISRIHKKQPEVVSP